MTSYTKSIYNGISCNLIKFFRMVHGQHQISSISVKNGIKGHYLLNQNRASFQSMEAKKCYK